MHHGSRRWLGRFARLINRMIGPAAMYIDRLLGPLIYRRAYFEGRFREIDPWRYLSGERERTRYRRMLDAGGVPASTLEIGCAEGVFTSLLAAAGSRVVGIDISRRAIARARARCAALTNVRFEECDVRRGLPSGSFERIFCTEVLYYLGSVKALARLRDRIVELLTVGGRLVLVHTANQTELFHATVFAARPELQLVDRRRFADATPPYEIAVFERVSQQA